MLWLQHADRPFRTHGWWWEFLAGILPVLLLALLIVVVGWAVLRFTARGPSPAQGPPPATTGRPDVALEEVRLRYARGEMSREEFIQRWRDLGGIEPRPPEPPPSSG